MEAVCFPKMSVNFCQTIQHHIPESSTACSHWCEKLWSHIIAESEIPSNMDHISKHVKENCRLELGGGKYQLTGGSCMELKMLCYKYGVRMVHWCTSHIVCKITVFTVVIYSWELSHLMFKHISQNEPVTLINVHSSW
jgi:hypothetical protein